MKRIIFIFSFFILLFGCRTEEKGGTSNTNKNTVNISGMTVMERISPPKGYEWVNEPSGSFGEYLQNLVLKEHGAQVLEYNGSPIYTQNAHVAVVDKDIGKKDLQQCADVIIRLRADYLWEKNRQDDIKFHFTSGDLFKWSDYKKGIRALVTPDNRVSFEQTATPDDSYSAYQKYMEIIYIYAGTISLNKETYPVRSLNDIKTGDFINTPGSPGHAVFIIGTAVNKDGEKLYLLAQGYTPAQSIHVMTNPFDDEINPWYELNLQGGIKTARYNFEQSNIRSFD